MSIAEIVSSLFSFEDYGELVALLTNSLIAAALLGVVGGLISVFVMARDIPFAVHGVSELSFAGAAFALLVGFDVVGGSIAGSILAALIIGIGGARASEKNAIIGVLMPFGLGLAILFLALYDGRSASKFGLLTGQIVAITPGQILTLIVCALIVLVVLAVVWRPLLFASLDPEVARAKGVPVSGLTIVFMLVLGLAVALSVQVVGVLLVLALLITPAAAATQVSASPVWVPVLSVVFAVTASVGGILLALGSPVVPISPFVTTISFLIYLVCRVIGHRRLSSLHRRRAARAERGTEHTQSV
ncbi:MULTISPECIES: metal ABC transporter permease [Brevibacterium]|uniref:Metal ABC transporter permease n=1 Tax=Brevibacterium casei TaxID=33889 RepID=A0A7T9TKX5_9MICO|nr:metal ABC transporter permease [Brevibacterium casei]NJE67523.1 metal ABC transporter permease [Brevibacterium sp. LS14]MBE4694273.1 metal ABC transporter permease [Brevibacterium casei]MBY3577396.1 metal ABC transporter permease [Brevibacterium casei]MCT1448737.1 metal ABC transporter permease [Brevibacterium casei]MCT1551434.1 metal ABC transporter permease [Brevibacterium casei]